MEHADIKTENESLMEQLEELKTSKMTISDTISGAMASIQGGTALSSEIFDRSRNSQSLTSQAQTNQLRKQCDVLKNENLKLLNTKSQVLRDVRTLTPEYADRNAAMHLLRVCSRHQRRGYMYGTKQSKARSVRQARDVYRREFIGAARVEADCPRCAN